MIISRGDIELVRKWRNSEEISRTMIYKEYITCEMQKKWFDSINNKYNLYFIIEYKGKKIGLINGKDIDYEKMSMETGVFYWDKSILKSHIPVICSLIFAEIGVKIFKLTAYAKIRKDNTNARRFNKLLGFEVYKNIDPEYQLYKMNIESYTKRSKVIMKAFNIILPKGKTNLLLEDRDYECGIAQIIENNLPEIVLYNSENTDKGKLYYF